jgi:hypothetical protein
MRAATSEFGTSRHFASAQQFGRIWSEADINHRAHSWVHALKPAEAATNPKDAEISKLLPKL